MDATSIVLSRTRGALGLSSHFVSFFPLGVRFQWPLGCSDALLARSALGKRETGAPRFHDGQPRSLLVEVGSAAAPRRKGLDDACVQPDTIDATCGKQLDLEQRRVSGEGSAQLLKHVSNLADRRMSACMLLPRCQSKKHVAAAAEANLSRGLGTSKDMKSVSRASEPVSPILVTEPMSAASCTTA
jgi:hypothetical protein